MLKIAHLPPSFGWSPFPVKRQKVILHYIVDFYIPSRKLVIEVDGSQHYEQTGRSRDLLREEDLNRLGLTVLRYSNWDIRFNLRGVAEDILRHWGESSAAPL